jgi:hypothetical protein
VHGLRSWDVQFRNWFDCIDGVHRMPVRKVQH